MDREPRPTCRAGLSRLKSPSNPPPLPSPPLIKDCFRRPICGAQREVVFATQIYKYTFGFPLNGRFGLYITRRISQSVGTLPLETSPDWYRTVALSLPTDNFQPFFDSFICSCFSLSCIDVRLHDIYPGFTVISKIINLTRPSAS